MCLACGKRCDTQVLHGVIVGLWEVQRALFDVEGNEQGRGDVRALQSAVQWYE